MAGQHGEVVAWSRFPIGLYHVVLDVSLAGGKQLVVRVTSPEDRELAAGALAWSGVLRPLGVPLPELLAHDVSAGAPMPYLVLERLRGDDLDVVFPTLSGAERRALARDVAEVQLHVGRTASGRLRRQLRPDGPAAAQGLEQRRPGPASQR